MIEGLYVCLFVLTVLSAAAVVFTRHAVYSALSLIVTMVSIAAIFILMNAQLAAVLQILVYAGAIMVLFLFVIMLLNLGKSGSGPAATRGVRKIGAVLFIALLVQLTALGAKFGGGMTIDPEHVKTNSIVQAAMVLQTRYVYLFEATSILLLVAVVGAMVLGRRSISPRPGAEG